MVPHSTAPFQEKDASRRETQASNASWKESARLSRRSRTRGPSLERTRPIGGDWIS